MASIDKLPLAFEPAPSGGNFVWRRAGYRLTITRGEVEIVSGPARVTMKMLGANQRTNLEGLKRLEGHTSYFLGSDPAGWRTGVPQFEAVEQRDIYPGVDVIYYGSRSELEYDIIVAPGVEPSIVRLKFEGASRLRLDHGDLVIQTPAAEIRKERPRVYQKNSDATRLEIAGGYRLLGRNRVGFEIGAYDRARPLVIDPVVRKITIIGGTRDEIAYAVGVDQAGNRYLTGYTTSLDFPTVSGSYQSPTRAAEDVFVAKVDPTGTKLLYTAFLGGRGTDIANALAVDGAGNAYIAGQTNSSDFPTTGAVLQTALAAGQCSGTSGSVPCSDAFVAKLSPDGTRLVYSTFFGGTSVDFASGIAVDSAGNAHVVGTTASNNLRTTQGAYQAAYNGGADGFVLKLNPTATQAIYATYFGGSGAEVANGIALDSSGNAYITGQTFSTNLRTTPGVFQPAKSGGTCADSPQPPVCSDAFLAKLNAAGTTAIFLTYLGGTGNDFAQRVAVDAQGNVYVVGSTNAADFPTLHAAQPRYGGGSFDAFVTEFNPSATALVFSTYLGGSGVDNANSIKVGSDGVVSIVIDSNSPDFGKSFTKPTGAHIIPQDLFCYFLKMQGVDPSSVDSIFGSCSDLDSRGDTVGSAKNPTIGTDDTTLGPGGGADVVLIGHTDQAPLKKAVLTVKKDSGVGPDSKDFVVRAGAPFVFTFEITNSGDDTADPVALTDPLPSLKFAGGTECAGAPVLGGIVTCNVGSIAAGQSKTITFSAVADYAGTYSNQAVIQWTDSSGGGSAISNTIQFKIANAKPTDTGVKNDSRVPAGGKVQMVQIGDGNTLKPKGASQRANASPTATVVAANGVSDSVGVIECQGPTCALARTIAMPKGSNSIALAEGDFDGDQLDDYIALNQGSGTVAVFLSSAAGTAPVISSVGASPAAMAVIPGSSPPRLAVVRQGADASTPGALEIFAWDGVSQFTSQHLVYTIGPVPSAVIATDLNGDGQTDLLVLNRGSGIVSVFLGDGNGAFQPATDFATGDSPSAMALADLNNDGVPDLAVTSVTTGSVNILLGDGAGGFGAPTGFDAAPGAMAIVAADFNGDGNLDLAVVSPDVNVVAFLRGDGSGNFSDAGKYRPGDQPVTLAVLDFDGDGIPDLVVGNNGSQDLSILLIQN